MPNPACVAYEAYRQKLEELTYCSYMPWEELPRDEQAAWFAAAQAAWRLGQASGFQEGLAGERC
jgi:hypothetical protein